MAYSTNPATVEARLVDPFLGPGLVTVQAGLTAHWTFTSDPLVTQRVARQLREVLALAARYPKRFPQLAAAAELFVIKVVRDGYIEAVYKSVPKTETSVSRSTPVHGLEPQGTPVMSVAPNTAEEIKNAWQAHLPSSDSLHFTAVGLDEEEMRDLWEWAVNNTPRLMVLYDDERATLTLSLLDPTVLEFAWSPPQAQLPVPEERLDV